MTDRITRVSTIVNTSPNTTTLSDVIASTYYIPPYTNYWKYPTYVAFSSSCSLLKKLTYLDNSTRSAHANPLLKLKVNLMLEFNRFY